MIKTDKYYVDEDKNMIRYTGQYKGVMVEMPVNEFHAKLKLVDIEWLNSGSVFIVEDEDGRKYYLNDTMMRKYIEKNSIVLEGNWTFYKQGVSYSIGLSE